MWADGWYTLQLHQQRLTPDPRAPDMDGLLTTFSVSGTRPHGCVLVEPARQLIEEYGILVGHTLVDASSGSGSVLIVNPNVEVVVLPSLTFIGKLVPVAAISIAMEDTGPSMHDPDKLPEYLEEIVKGSHPSLDEPGRQLLRDLLLRYRHVFRRRGNQLPAGLRQFNMTSLRRTPDRSVVDQDGWLRPDSEKNRHV